MLQLWCQPLPPICMQVQRKEWADMMQVVCTTVQSSSLIMAIRPVFISNVLSTTADNLLHSINGLLELQVITRRHSLVQSPVFFHLLLMFCSGGVLWETRAGQLNLPRPNAAAVA